MKYKGKEIRHELKYFINEHEYLYLRTRLKDGLMVDKNGDEKNTYHIRSLYFDDIYDTAYKEKEMGVQFRKKYRIRIYNLNDNVIKLERKNKYGSYINKDAATLTKSEFYKILNKDYDFLLESNNGLLRDFYVECKSNLMAPKIIVDYDREAYILPMGNVRITFDKQLRAGINSFDIFDKNVITKRIYEEPIMIMEIKYDSFLPEHVKNLIQICSHNISAASKYVLCRKVIKNIKY